MLGSAENCSNLNLFKFKLFNKATVSPCHLF